jgi:hypothetical protein
VIKRLIIISLVIFVVACSSAITLDISLSLIDSETGEVKEVKTFSYESGKDVTWLFAYEPNSNFFISDFRSLSSPVIRSRGIATSNILSGSSDVLSEFAKVYSLYNTGIPLQLTNDEKETTQTLAVTK